MTMMVPMVGLMVVVVVMGYWPLMLCEVPMSTKCRANEVTTEKKAVEVGVYFVCILLIGSFHG
jgi:hypothetical protein